MAVKLDCHWLCIPHCKQAFVTIVLTLVGIIECPRFEGMHKDY